MKPRHAFKMSRIAPPVNPPNIRPISVECCADINATLDHQVERWSQVDGGVFALSRPFHIYSKAPLALMTKDSVARGSLRVHERDTAPSPATILVDYIVVSVIFCERRLLFFELFAYLCSLPHITTVCLMEKPSLFPPLNDP